MQSQSGREKAKADKVNVEKGKVVYVTSALDSLALARKNLGSINLRGGIDLNRVAERRHLGVVGIQETLTLGVESRTYKGSIAHGPCTPGAPVAAQGAAEQVFWLDLTLRW